MTIADVSRGDIVRVVKPKADYNRYEGRVVFVDAPHDSVVVQIDGFTHAGNAIAPVLKVTEIERGGE